MRKTRWLVTCEHASQRVPKAFLPLFHESFEQHQWYDIGALKLAKQLAQQLSAPLFFGTVTRLLVDLNRSLHSRSLFSHVTRNLPADVREHLLERYYFPFRNGVERHVSERISEGERVIHLSCHSFTPLWKGVTRQIDVGLLYDPSRILEATFCREVASQLQSETAMRVRLNAPYRGVSDGLATHLRKKFPPEQYLGLELEVNQGLLTPPEAALWRKVWLPSLQRAFLDSIPAYF